MNWCERNWNLHKGFFEIHKYVNNVCDYGLFDSTI